MENVTWIGKTDTPKLGWEQEGSNFQKLHDDAVRSVNPEKRGILFRKEFHTEQVPVSATVSVCGLGFYQLYLNGKKAGNYVLTPLETNYNKWVLYDEYDVTDLIKEGVNAIGAELGNARYSTPKKYWSWRAAWYGDPCLACRLTITYRDGSSETIETGTDWKCDYGPILKNCFYDGETYDARLEQAGWNEVGFDDGNWQAALSVPKPFGTLEKNNYFHLKKQRTVKPVKIYKKLNGRTIYSFGENISGWVKVRLKGPEGEQIRIRYAEKINPIKGYLDVFSNRNAENTDYYTLNGGQEEEYEPKFTLRGFCAVEISDEDCFAEILDVEAYHVYADVEQTGFFSCDNEKINHLHDVILRTQKSALQSVPMDCPQRDERLGWLGDAQVTAAVCMYNFDCAKFHAKFLEDIRVCAEPKSGAVSFLAPWHAYSHAVDFGIGYLVILWEHYLFYRDTALLAHHCNDLIKYVDYLGTLGPILDRTRYGDWMSSVEGWVRGDPACSSSLCYYYALLLLVKILNVLEKNELKAHYEKLAKQESEAILRQFYDAEEKGFDDNSQFSLSFALKLGLIPKEDERAVLTRLLEDIKNRNYHLTTGIFGTKYIMDVLQTFEEYDTAMKLILQEDYPSWLNLIGDKTSLPEKWDGSGSQNHCMLGSVDSVFYSMIAGIRVAEQIEILPAVCEGVQTVSARVSFGAGRISLTRTPEKLVLDIENLTDVFFKGAPLSAGHHEIKV